MSSIGTVLLDIDGVLTDGRVWIGPDGQESKVMGFRDVDAFFRIRRMGLQLGFVTGEDTGFCDYVEQRFSPEFFLRGEKNKLTAYRSLADRHGWADDEVCYVGDSHHDVELLRALPYSFAPHDAHAEVRGAATTTLQASRGGGVLEELADWLASHQGL